MKSITKIIDGKTINTKYINSNNQPICQLDSNDNIEKVYMYDKNNRLILKLYNKGIASIEYQYLNDKLLSVKHRPYNLTEVYAYNKNNQLDTIVTSQGYRTVYKYDDNGNEINILLYDNKGEIYKETIKTYKNNRLESEEKFIYRSNNINKIKFLYEYNDRDLLSRRLHFVYDKINETYKILYEYSYEYDAYINLIKEICRYIGLNYHIDNIIEYKYNCLN